MEQSPEYPITGNTSNWREDWVQILLVGPKTPELEEALERIRDRIDNEIHVMRRDVESTSWQRKRSASKAWAIVTLPLEQPAAVEETANWIQMVSLVFRPQRLVVFLPDFRLGRVLEMVRAGADGILGASSAPDEILAELDSAGTRGAEYFPDPNQWLTSLRRSAEELLLGEDATSQYTKLLRIFVRQLKADRASVLLLKEEGKAELAAGLGMPADLPVGSSIDISETSITSWVIENRQSRIVEGRYAESAGQESGVNYAICVPLVASEALLGVVNFSSTGNEKGLNASDRAAAEVFASLLSLSIENHRLQREQIESERLATIGRTTATVAHGIKNILQVFKGSTVLLARNREEGGNPESFKKGVDMLSRATQRLEDMVLELLDFSKTREPVPVPSSPEDLINEVVALFQPPFVHIEYDFRTDCRIAEALMLDQQRIQRALINLVRNATETMPQGGTIHLSVFKRGDHVVFGVSDEGPGVLDSEIAEMFEPFYSTKGPKGTGLGLALVRKVCEENGGQVYGMRCPILGGLRVELELPWVPVYAD